MIEPRTRTADHRLRAAIDADVDGILRLVTDYAAIGNLLPRSAGDIRLNLGQFIVVERAGELVACGALERFTSELGEIRSLVVADSMKGRGLGAELVTRLTQQARESGLKRLMALTYVAEFFHRQGFVTVPKDSFPEKVWGICVRCYKFHNCDEIAVLKQLAPDDDS